MTKHKVLFSFLLAAATFGNAFSQKGSDAQMISRIREEGMSHSKVMETAFNLTDVTGPRLANSPGLKRAQDWSVNALKTWGLVNVKREPWGKFGKGWEVQKNYAAITVPYYHAVIAIPKAWTPGTNGPIKSEVVVVKADSIVDLASYKGKLKGKIVMLNTKPLAERSFEADATRITDAQLSEMAAAKASAGARPRAAGNMAALVNFRAALSKFYVEEGVGLVLSQGRGTDGTIFTSGGRDYADTSKTPAPELETSSEDFQRILRLVNAGVPVKMEAEVKTQFFADDLQGYNVVGELAGSDKKNELVIIGGHLDSWHAATGATDNAAGSAVMLEAMRILKSLGFKPRRTLRVVLWSSEEQGLHGSRNYVLNHYGDPKTMTLKSAQAKVSAYYNLDNGAGKIRGIYAQGNDAAGAVFKSWLEPFKDLGAATVTLNNTGSTDHIPFDAIGIPGFQFIQDRLDYGTRTHHSNQDTYDRLIEDDLKQAATVVATFVYQTSQREEMIPRKELPKPATATK
ncbi:M20/M25/M40 family metallo-hydrolase [Pedobacter sp. MC2016-15]|uniref:M28 family metallopeptidase n=1 Tax=Pedobacter sp. MC2016-15 TaxID=2994473 RepID=UPI00224795E7|nr:M20/M25/M40 family metallo-hydrolase [Pedobacter sp. MC2016-15]MCX2479076.1 M20/M25/M40 family metallo-hydrolase [Pedobacter sp. MC2016-15]